MPTLSPPPARARCPQARPGDAAYQENGHGRRGQRPGRAALGVVAAAVRRPRRPGGGGAAGRRGRGGRLARVLRLGSPELAGSGAAGGRPVDHPGGGHHRHRVPAARADGHAAGPLPAAKVARETATLDRLSGGRLTLGVGLGSDRFGAEFSATGEQLDDRLRGQMLDEALRILAAAWSGRPVHHSGAHYTVDGLRFLPARCSSPGCRCGSPASLGTPGHCAAPPGTMASSRSTWNTRTSSPGSPPPSPARAGIRPRLLTSR